MLAIARLEEKHNSLKNELAENLQKKRDLELQISHEFEELKILEISLEKRTCNNGEEAMNKKTSQRR